MEFVKNHLTKEFKRYVIPPNVKQPDINDVDMNIWNKLLLTYIDDRFNSDRLFSVVNSSINYLRNKIIEDYYINHKIICYLFGYIPYNINSNIIEILLHNNIFTKGMFSECDDGYSVIDKNKYCINCFNVINCTFCVSCRYSTNSNKLINCEVANDSVLCSNCKNIDYCVQCIRCNYLTNCTHCDSIEYYTNIISKPQNNIYMNLDDMYESFSHLTYDYSFLYNNYKVDVYSKITCFDNTYDINRQDNRNNTFKCVIHFSPEYMFIGYISRFNRDLITDYYTIDIGTFYCNNKIVSRGIYRNLLIEQGCISKVNNYLIYPMK